MAHHLARDVRGLLYRGDLPRADPRVLTTSGTGIRCVYREEGEVTLQVPLPCAWNWSECWRRQILTVILELQLVICPTPITIYPKPARYENNHTKPSARRSLNRTLIKRCRNNSPHTHRATYPRSAAHAAIRGCVFHHAACDVLQRVYHHMYIHRGVSGRIYLCVGAVGACGE